MDIDTAKITRGMVRAGTVSATNPAIMAARVVFEEQDGNVSPELPILTRGSGGNKDYWMPDVGDEVLCLFAPNDKNFSTGWILGTYFTAKHPPNAAAQDVRKIDFGDGSSIEFNRAAGSLSIKCTGPVTINGATINLN